MSPSYNPVLQQELNFLVFWGKYDAYTVKRMPTYWRAKHIDFTIKNLESLYGKSISRGSGESET